jgi:hypothetical protein
MTFYKRVGLMTRNASGFMTLLLLAALPAVAACDNKENAAKKESSSAAAAAHKEDPCSLLTPDEVAAVIGPLAGPPYRSGGGVLPSPNGTSCRYETADLHAIRVEVMWKGGAQFMGMMGAVQGAVKQGGLKELKLIDGTTVAGEWDEARVSQCCVFNALRGDQMVIVDIAGSRATLAQASSLADAALKRLDQPLKIDGGLGIKPAEERIALRPKARSVCDLVTKADAEAIAGVALLAAPKGNTDSCSYEWPLGTSGSFAIKLMVQWQGGFGAMREMHGAVSNATAMIGADKMFGQTAKQVFGQAAATNSDKGPWDEYSQSIIGVAAVKSDVMASIEGGPYKVDVQRALLEKAFVNLTK